MTRKSNQPRPARITGMSTHARKPAGSPGSTGGQFRETSRGEVDVDLDPAQWVQDGVTPHPTGGYVRVEQDNDAVRYLDSDGRLHRLDGPAVEWPNGTTKWYQRGRRHRDDGPAIEWSDGSKVWYQYGQLHRDGGPAIERADGRTEYWVDGRQLTTAEFEALPPASGA